MRRAPLTRRHHLALGFAAVLGLGLALPPAVPRAAAPFLLEVQGVNVASQADQPQLMVRTGDGSTALAPSPRTTSTMVGFS